jgi:enoyl-CoA hydratase/carnithine racemase
MTSMQTLEGSSSLTFPEQFGYRRAREILMLDSPIRAQEAVQCNFANGIIDDLGGEFFDIEKVPAIGKILNTDYRTLMEAKKLLIAAKDMDRIN